MFRTYIEVMLTQLADGSGIGCEESLDMTPRLLTKKTNRRNVWQKENQTTTEPKKEGIC